MQKRAFKFYIALFIAKFITFALNILKRNASQFPGKVAITICPEFLKYIEKPINIIGVTGTNGKTTVTNLITSILIDNGYDLISNRFGSNTNSGLASTLISGTTFMGKNKKKYAVLELDERSAKKIYPYIKPKIIVCTNLFRDSIRRNAHTEYILSILNSNIPKESKLILNGDDLICSSIGSDNEKVYYGISRLETDTLESKNIVRDIIVCPKCSTKLKYNYYRYNHIGDAYCPNCDFKSPDRNYFITKIDYDNKLLDIKTQQGEEKYTLINNNIINIYNVLSAVSALREFGLESSKIEQSLSKMKITETRYSEEIVNGKPIIIQLAKGQNPVACSRAFDFARNESGKKVVILILDDIFDAKNSSENTTWLYDADFELLNSEDIKQIIVAGARYLDDYLRLLLAGIPEEKIVPLREELDIPDYVQLDNIDKILILRDMWQLDNAVKIKEKIKTKLEQGDN